MDLRATVRTALTRLVADPAWWPAPDAARFHNRLLDETGDGGRELVAVVMALYACDVAGRLPRAVITREAWDTNRNALVGQFTAESHLHRSAIAWAVDSWAVALATIEPGLLDPVKAPADPRRTASDGQPSSPGGVRQSAPQPRSAGARASLRGNTSVAPSGVALGGGGSLLFGKWVGSPVPSSHWTQRMDLDRITMGLIVIVAAGTLGVQALSMRSGSVREFPPAAASSAASTEPQLVPTSESPVAPPRSLDPTLPATAADVAVDSARAAGAMPGLLPDTLRLRDGRVLLGDVRLLTESHVFLIERETGLPYEFRLADVRELAVHTGHAVRFSDRAGMSDVPEVTIVALGVAGRYRVHREIVSAQGSESCQLGVDAQRGAADTEELIGQQAGSPQFTMRTRPGVQGTIESDGRFSTEQLTGTRDGTSFTWHMEGRFTRTGFTAQSSATTDAMIGWRQQQQCRFVSVLTGERRP